MTDSRTVGRSDRVSNPERREFLGALGMIFLSVSQTVQQSDSVGRVYDPSRAGRAREVTTAADNDAAIQAVEKRLKCSCGCGLDIYTCRTTDFTCTYSPALHKEVVGLAEQGKTDQQIIDAFVAQYGEAALMAPPRRGFNLAGYFVPSLAIIVAAVFLVRVLRRWTREAQGMVPQTPSPEARAPNASPAELQRLRDELDRLSG
ncbi:MAG TPA: cytochrome c-type biogenesis protein CcmH [Gemmatimonadales bacterium]|nr:cytochrome c-type biogenesis protein CcmH [Gemmatimonadales bacterium]